MAFIKQAIARCAFASMLVAATAIGYAQKPNLSSAEEPLGPVVTGAPYSGDGITTLKLILYDGTRIERTVTARFYRDSAGRIRREQTVMGTEELTSSGDQAKIVTIVDPVASAIYSLSPGDLAYRMPLDKSAFAERSPSAAGAAAPLGTRQIDGMAATGSRTTITIPAGQVGNNRPIEVTDERWESQELKVLLLSRHHDPRSGDVEYRLTNVVRGEPSPDLFQIPSKYTIVGSVR